MPHPPESPPSVAFAPGRNTVFGVLDSCTEPAQSTGATLGVGRLFAVAGAAVPEALPQLPLRRLRPRRGRRWSLAGLARAIWRRPRVRFVHAGLLAAVVLVALVATIEPSREAASTASRDAGRTHADAVKRARPPQSRGARNPREPRRRDRRERPDARKVSPGARAPRVPAVRSPRPARRSSARASSPPPQAPRAPALPAPVPAGAPPEFP